MPWAVAAAAVGVVGSYAVSERNADRAEEMSNKQAQSADTQMALANEQWNKYLELYGPLEEELVNESRDYGSEANKTKAAEEAAGQVASSYSNLRQRLNSTPGLDPSSDRYQKMLAKMSIAEAANSASAQTGARRQVEQEGRARKLDAMSLGKGLPANASSSLAQATGTYGQIARQADNQASQQGYGFGRMVGDVLNNKTFQNNVGGWFNNSGGQSYTGTNDFAGTSGGAEAMDDFMRYGSGGD
jgi:hypothetical protein